MLGRTGCLFLGASNLELRLAIAACSRSTQLLVHCFCALIMNTVEDKVMQPHNMS